jgi:hypothetical protein
MIRDRKPVFLRDVEIHELHHPVSDVQRTTRHAPLGKQPVGNHKALCAGDGCTHRIDDRGAGSDGHLAIDEHRHLSGGAFGTTERPDN